MSTPSSLFAHRPEVEPSSDLAPIAYQAYRKYLQSRTRNWHELKKTVANHENTPEAFDEWLRTQVDANLPRYFMGDYDAMPPHTKKGWHAFAENAGGGPEAAWNSYADAALSNFHKDSGTTLPRYETLDKDQQEAITSAITCVLSDASRLVMGK